MGIPQIGTRTLWAIDKHRICFRNLYRAENLRYQFKQGQKLPPQFRQIICLVKVGRDTRTRYYGCGRLQPIRSVLIHGMCLFEDGIGVATATSLRAPSFRRTQAPFASTTTSCSCSPWFFVLLFPHDKNFAFIFDMQALVRLFLLCGSPCVRSTSECAVLLRSWRTKRSGTAFSRFVLQTPRMPFVACNELAIATKSIASVCPHAERTPWVPF